MLTILVEYCQNGMKFNHLKTGNLPYKPLYFSTGSKHLEPDSKYNELIGTKSAVNCLHLDPYFSDPAEICQ